MRPRWPRTNGFEFKGAMNFVWPNGKEPNIPTDGDGERHAGGNGVQFPLP
jgi:hypothetical protein